VFVDEIGRPYRPGWYSTRFTALGRAAKLPRIRLHDTRHTCGSLMHDRGVPIAVISKWLGHAKASFTIDTYVHATIDGMDAAATTLRGAYAPAQRTAPSDV
jgi:integrase